VTDVERGVGLLRGICELGRRTADPSAAVGMTNFRVVASVGIGLWRRELAWDVRGEERRHEAGEDARTGR
jgi:hypothetical protein